MVWKKHQKRPTEASSSCSSSGTKLKISSDIYTRLRNLLLKSRQVLPPIQVDNNLAVARISKGIISLYEKLSCDGFSDDQIERALYFLKGRDSVDAALDFLCLNLSGNELPPKFSDVTSQDKAEGGSVGVVLKAREDWVPSSRSYSVSADKPVEVPVKISARRDYGNTLDSPIFSQSDWIRQYVEQQEEEEDDENWCDDLEEKGFPTEKAPPVRSQESIVKEYKIARLDALRAKERGDKKCQEHAGKEIRKLKQEIADLGLSADVLEFSLIDKTADTPVVGYSLNDEESSIPDLVVEKSSENESPTEISEESDVGCSPLADFNQEDVGPEDGSDDAEFGDIFVEGLNSIDILPPSVVDLHMRETMKQLSSQENMDKLNGIWKKGDQLKLPKSVLHQMCRRSGWEAPKFSKLHNDKHLVSYSVSVLRTSCGRGKNRKAGGLITIQLPSEDENSFSVEDSQNSVSTFALCCLFPELPLQIIFTEPYALLAMRWKRGDSLTEIERNSEDRRSAFVKSLLNSLIHDTNMSSGESRNWYHEETDGHHSSGNTKSINGDTSHNGFHLDVESLHLKRHYENKQKLQKYQDIMKDRSGLPISKLKGQILGLLKENNILVICGETGCGKTTQVPQFILEDMIEAGHGGCCNIICTQPRRIAAISVAERVSYERCEGLPGSESSLVGYQVRLSSSRNENTKLLFCTTGILLRKMTGDPSLLDITHVIVDEVHERTVLGDFLLIVLRNLIEKTSVQGRSKLKIILMSATMDSKLFSTYFGCCPVIMAEGRTFPVTTYFLEDVYESLKYKLASDSPASIEQEPNFYVKIQKSSGYQKVKKDLGSLSMGDETFIADDCLNPFYVSSCYQSYSEQTHLNLKRLCEDVIDYELMEDLVFFIDENFAEGAILVFLPGVSEIYILLERLCGSYHFGGAASDWIFPLHSSISPAEQKKVFLQPPMGIRKIIIATNIAETSITIDDVVYVIDCGRHKEKRYNTQKKLSSMVEDWISRANAKQRRGRAGRVKPGILFCLFTSHRYKKLMRLYQVPEMLRVQLTELCLQVKMLSLGDIRSFLLKALEPPNDAAITSAVSLLHEVGALQGDEELTPLGCHLARLPVDVTIGKMMLFGAIFCCLSPILSISAFMSYKSPFSFRKDEQRNVESIKLALLNNGKDNFCKLVPSDMQSDHLILASAYSTWEKILREKGSKDAETFCNKNFLISSVMYMIRDMRVQFGTLLADIGLIDLPTQSKSEGKNKDNLAYSLSDKSQIFNSCSHQTSIVKAILVAGLYPNVAATEEGIMETTMSSFKHNLSQSTLNRPVWYDGKREVRVHHSSLNAHHKVCYYPFLVFLEKVETSKIFLRDTSVVSPSSIILFGGSVNIHYQMGMVSIGGWLKLKATAQTAVLFKEVRSNLESLLKDLIKHPQMRNVGDNELLRAIVDLLCDEEK